MTRLAIDATSDAQVARPGHRWVLELPDDPVLVLGDEHRLQQVLANLLSNAGRHTPDGTTVTVAVSDALPTGEPAHRGRVGPRTATSRPRPGWWSPSPTTARASRPTCCPTCSSGSPGPTRPARTPATPHPPGSGWRSWTPWSPPTTARSLVTSRPGMTRFTIVLRPAAPSRLPRTARRGGRRAPRRKAAAQVYSGGADRSDGGASLGGHRGGRGRAAGPARPCSGPRRISAPQMTAPASEDARRTTRTPSCSRGRRPRPAAATAARGRPCRRQVAGEVAGGGAGRDRVQQRGADRAAELLAGVDRSPRRRPRPAAPPRRCRC